MGFVIERVVVLATSTDTTAVQEVYIIIYSIHDYTRDGNCNVWLNGTVPTECCMKIVQKGESEQYNTTLS